MSSQHVLRLEEQCLLVLCGPSGSGKSHFARRWFRDTEIVSFREASRLVFDKEVLDETATAPISLLFSMVEHRLQANKMTVVDTRTLQSRMRRHLVHLARHYQMPVYLLLMDHTLKECRERLGDLTEDEEFQLQSQHQQMQTVSSLAAQEGFSAVYRLSQFGTKGPFPLREPLAVHSDREGPFDMIGDVHGCYDELVVLLGELGYSKVEGSAHWAHPEGRTAVFLGDLVDRGPQSLQVVALVSAMVEAGEALYVPGNHCDKFARYLRGNKVMVNHGLETTVGELNMLDVRERETLTRRFMKMYENSSPYLLLDRGKVLVSHAGLPEFFHGRMSQRIRAFALYGEVTGETDEFGRPMRRDWAQEYFGRPLVVYGHTPVLYPRFVNNSLNLDQGCVFGGSLSAMRYPERDIVSVPAKYIYWRPN